jgi:hypothetical protein
MLDAFAMPPGRHRRRHVIEPLVLAVFAVALFAAAAVVAGAYRWARETGSLHLRLEAARLPVQPATVDFCELDGLPAPVQRYFRAVLKAGQPIPAGAHIRHRGSFNMGATGDNWKPFTSDQKVVTRRSGFDWNARIRLMPGVTVRVHDAYIAGEGSLHAAVLGLMTVADLHGTPAMSEGEQMRFVAEAAWYPTALLPSQGVRWQAVDADSARATHEDGEHRVTLLFRFGAHGLIDSIHADARGRTVGSRIEPTPWQGRFWHYAVRDGMLIPLDGEVAWCLPEGPKTYWRGHLTTIHYDKVAASGTISSTMPVGAGSGIAPRPK